MKFLVLMTFFYSSVGYFPPFIKADYVSEIWSSANTHTVHTYTVNDPIVKLMLSKIYNCK